MTCRFRAVLLSELSNANIEENEEGLSEFLNTCKRILDLHAPRKVLTKVRDELKRSKTI